MSPKNHISVCICTYKRPHFLEHLLYMLDRQITDNRFDISITVVDNDNLASAEVIVDSFRKQSTLPIRYHNQPVQNISLARNMAIENSNGDFLAFIDDDEYPAEDWLLHLHGSIHEYRSEGILGPVLPNYEEQPPKWVLKGRFFDRPKFQTGHRLDWEDTRTGNVLMRSDIFKTNNEWFDPDFGSGGEDRDFFRRKIGEGAAFVWCNEAVVFETIPSRRWKRSIMLKRALLRGKVSYLNSPCKMLPLLKSLSAVVVYSILLPLLLPFSHHLFMRYLVKSFDHIGKLLTSFGFNVVQERYIS